ncbi:MAG: hypothetical protein WC670_01390 [Pseudolabrys sp.]|jgi:hypothetical protein
MALTIGIEFRDLAKVPADRHQLQTFMVQSIVPVMVEQVMQNSTRAADPVLDEREVKVSIGFSF